MDVVRLGGTRRRWTAATSRWIARGVLDGSLGDVDAYGATYAPSSSIQ